MTRLLSILLLLAASSCASGPPTAVEGRLCLDYLATTDAGQRAAECDGNPNGCYQPDRHRIVIPYMQSWRDGYSQRVTGHEVWHELRKGH